MTVDLIIFFGCNSFESKHLAYKDKLFKLKEAFESIMPVNTEHFIFVIYSI
ncbi:hypothetical protein Lp19_1640 [Lactiplantibacillus plantarum]|uniref:Uncharacterized protein n=1 Tax=Lactiplantibacillus plantarum TaxID=1590 RepID=A0A165RML6_LACPN|nr:hypothetical protein Lp19_1640 [Lactiplantibacillus plantarum]